jgi:aldoxime dehydratase
MEGIAVTAEALSDMVQEHAYWGGMRDRIPLSQTDAMKADGGPKADGANGHVRIVPHENLCLIRSGQDWSDTDDAERKMYIEDV